jgi:hypothetical protein
MKDTVVRRIVSTTIAALFVAGGAAVAAAPAYADSEADDYFMDFLDKKNFPYENRTETIRLAKEYCLDQTRQGNPHWLASYQLQQDQGWSGTETQTFIGAAIPVYCPQVWE